MKNRKVETTATKNLKSFENFVIKAKAQKAVKGGVVIEEVLYV